MASARRVRRRASMVEADQDALLGSEAAQLDRFLADTRDPKLSRLARIASSALFPRYFNSVWRTDTMANQSPEKTFRIGNCSASVFVNTTNGRDKKRQFRRVNVQRSYLDGEDRKFTASFGLNDLPAAIRVLQLAQQHLEEHEATVGE